MNYSQNIEKISYETEIGEFEVTDLSTYYILTEKNYKTGVVDVSSNTTLLELSNTIYSDINKFWYFLYANDSINPFNLFETDSADNISKYNTEIQINNIDLSSGVDVILTEGSIILPYVNNSGATWQYGSTGNFSLTGGFGFVKEFSPFTKIATITQVNGVTFALNNNVNFIINGSTYSFKGTFDGTTYNVNYIEEKTESIKEIKYKQSNTLIPYALLEDDLPPVSKGSSVSFSGITQSISYSTFEKTKNTNIKYFLPYSNTGLNFTKIQQNYIV